MFFNALLGQTQTVWGELFSDNKGKEIEQAYQAVSSGSQDELTQEQLVKYVKTLNEYALLNFSELNATFQKKVLSYIVSTDSLAAYQNRDNLKWWRSKFMQLIEIMPIFAIQKQSKELTKPIDTLKIQVPGTEKVISVIVNNKVIQGYLLSMGDNPSLAEKDIRTLFSEDVYDVIAYYRGEKKLPDTESSNDQYYAENGNDVKGKTVVLADNNSTQTNQGSNYQNSNENSDGTSNTNRSNTNESSNNSNSGNNINSNTKNTYTEGVAYRVQIAAARKSLSNSEIKNKYSGERKTKTFNEEGWIKYYVAETADLSQAKKISTEPGMPTDAFIMSYYNGEKAPEYLHRNYEPKPVLAKSYLDLAPETYGKKIWVVQIAADQNPLEMANIRTRYNGNRPVYHVNEGVWHRYSIGIFKSFKEANKLRMKCGVSDAFVAAYLDARRINTWASIKKPAQISKKPIRYIVQVAAAQRKLSDKDVKEKYTGSQEIIYFRENGYHKYAIGRYKTFKEALKVREECGVPDAFIKAYRGTQKVDLIRAKSITDK